MPRQVDPEASLEATGSTVVGRRAGRMRGDCRRNGRGELEVLDFVGGYAANHTVAAVATGIHK